MSSLGIRTVDELVGRVDLLEPNKDILPWKGKRLDFSRILYRPDVPKGVDTYCTIKQDHGIDKILDLKLIELAKEALVNSKPVKIELPINNTNRTTGAMLSGEVCRIHGEVGLPEDTINCKFTGAAGQSFGAFLAKGATFELEGMANDYIGKGISGGKIIVVPDRRADYKPEENIIIGNTTFYGAITGEAYIRGVSGERFCIRNSGLNAVVEGVGDHGCEYMTGGIVIVLGKTGRNFGAGMSGGVAYIYDKDKKFKDKCNMDMVELETLKPADEEHIRNLLSSHLHYTKSSVAKKILNEFHKEKNVFVKVMPTEYKRILESRAIKKTSRNQEVSDG